MIADNLKNPPPHHGAGALVHKAPRSFSRIAVGKTRIGGCD